MFSAQRAHRFGRSLKIGALVVALTMAMAMIGCSGQTQTQSSSSNAEGSSANEAAATVRIGTMPTEDMLPCWVAESEGLFEDANADVEIVVFDSAPALSSAITAGEVDMAMTDIMRAVKLYESGSAVAMEWITLGADAEQGRFGVLAPADAPYSTLQELADYIAASDSADGMGVGVAANTVPEYVFDKLCEEQGIEQGAIPEIEVASLPERFSLTASGNLAAAALPNSLLVLGESKGMKVLADDTTGNNISQSVMVARQDWAQQNADLVRKVAQCWDEAVDLLDQNPENYTTLLIEKANINGDIADVYAVSAYPFALKDGSLAHPDAAYVDELLTWMRDKGYGAEGITYDATTGEFSK